MKSARDSGGRLRTRGESSPRDPVDGRRASGAGASCQRAADAQPGGLAACHDRRVARPARAGEPEVRSGRPDCRLPAVSDAAARSNHFRVRPLARCQRRGSRRPTLAILLRGIRSKVNLIPPQRSTRYSIPAALSTRRSTASREPLAERQVVVSVRKSRDGTSVPPADNSSSRERDQRRDSMLPPCWTGSGVSPRDSRSLRRRTQRSEVLRRKVMERGDGPERLVGEAFRGARRSTRPARRPLSRPWS